MTAKELLYELYKKCYEQKAVLAGAPILTLDVMQYSKDTLPQEKAQEELKGVISYLLGKSLNKLSFDEILSIVAQNYQNQPFWRDLILDFLDWQVQLEKETILRQKENLSNEIGLSLKKINTHLAERKSFIQNVSEKIKKEKFSVNAEKLVRNFLHACQIDSEKAWAVLTKNPAYFSPIITLDGNGKEILSPVKAESENKRLAHFFTKITI